MPRRLLYCLLACLTALLLAAPAGAQWLPVIDEPDPTEAAFGWRPNAERPCGRLVCSNVYLYGSRGVSFTIAGPAATLQAATPDASTLDVETRAKLVQRSFREVLRVVRSQPTVQNTLATVDVRLTDLITPREGLHPSTPQVLVGLENEQTVVFLSAQPDYGLQQQTLVTVTEFDALHNGQPKDDLAKAWQAIISTSLSHKLWERSFDTQYAWAKPVIAIALVALAALLTAGIEFARRKCRSRSRTLRKRLKNSEKELKKSMTVDPEAITPEDAQPPADAMASPLSPQWTPQMSSQPFSNHAFKPLTVVSEAGQSVNHFLATFSKAFLKEQTLLKQQRNLLQFVVQLIVWLEVCVFFVAGGAIAWLYPITRPYAPYVFSQAILLPIIWLGVTLLDTLLDVEIDYYLNQWGKNAQLDDPQANRVALRVSTYSPALQSATTLFFTALGAYLTVQAFGIDPAVLASAGAIAVVFAFVSRNVLQDMLNGAVILWTDRFAVGDVIKVGEYAGLVEEMSLYTTQIRGPEGRLITIPNGQITTVENLTKDWSRVDFTIEIAYDADIKQALEIIRTVADTMRTDPLWQDKILEPASVLGVDQISHAGILLQVWIKTQAMQQWAVGREFRLRIKQAFDEAGIQIGLPQQSVVLRR
ncbi:MAG: mechanosensitive ion channel family protein [Cyanobacteria bacterium J06635_1]